MRDTKTILLLVVSVLLLGVSMILIWMWGYRSASGTATPVQATVKPSTETEPTIAQKINESVNYQYLNRLEDIGRSIDSITSNSDTVKNGLVQNLNEFGTLRLEINELLNRQPNATNIVAATRKIQELQERLRSLSQTNKDIEYENKRLNFLLQQLTAMQKNMSQSEVADVMYNQGFAGDKRNAQPVATVNNNNSTAAAVPVNAAEKQASPVGPSFTAFDLRLTAYNDVTGDNAKETELAAETNKIVGAFTFRNNNTKNNMAEVVVVVRQPDGKVLQKSSWESGSFEPKEGGRMIYSCKLKYDYGSWEAKRLFFTLVNDNYPKGKYNMFVYHNGEVIAKLSKILE